MGTGKIALQRVHAELKLIQGPHLTRVNKDTRMNSSRCREGPIENAYVQGSEFCASPLPGQSTFRTREHARECGNASAVIFICKVSF